MIFISHATIDDDFVNELDYRLKRAGYTTWVDHHNTIPGHLWSEIVDKKLKESELMIFVLSPESVASANVQAEWHEFKSQNKLIIPVILRDCVRPLLIRHLNYIDFRNVDMREASFLKLLHALPSSVPSVTAPIPKMDDMDQKLIEIKRRVSQLELFVEHMVGHNQLLFAFPELKKSMLIDIEHEKLIIGWRRDVTDAKPHIDLTHYGAYVSGVSRQHALIQNTNKGLYVIDLGSKNGTYINRQKLPIDKPVKLPNGAVLTIGNLSAQVFFRAN